MGQLCSKSSRKIKQAKEWNKGVTTRFENRIHQRHKMIEEKSNWSCPENERLNESN